MFPAHVLYRISWHINDPKTWMNFAQICKTTAAAARHWMKVKKTEFRKPILNMFFASPNGEIHGPSSVKIGSMYIESYFIDGYRNGDKDAPYCFKIGNFLVAAMTNQIKWTDCDKKCILALYICNDCNGYGGYVRTAHNARYFGCNC